MIIFIILLDYTIGDLLLVTIYYNSDKDSFAIYDSKYEVDFSNPTSVLDYMEIISEYKHTYTEYNLSNTKMTLANIKSINFLTFDFETKVNKHGDRIIQSSINEVRSKFLNLGINYIIYNSKSHKLPENDVYNDCYHLVIPLSREYSLSEAQNVRKKVLQYMSEQGIITDTRYNDFRYFNQSRNLMFFDHSFSHNYLDEIELNITNVIDDDDIGDIHIEKHENLCEDTIIKKNSYIENTLRVYGRNYISKYMIMASSFINFNTNQKKFYLKKQDWLRLMSGIKYISIKYNLDGVDICRRLSANYKHSDDDIFKIYQKITFNFCDFNFLINTLVNITSPEKKIPKSRKFSNSLNLVSGIEDSVINTKILSKIKQILGLSETSIPKILSDSVNPRSLYFDDNGKVYKYSKKYLKDLLNDENILGDAIINYRFNSTLKVPNILDEIREEIKNARSVSYKNSRQIRNNLCEYYKIPIYLKRLSLTDKKCGIEKSTKQEIDKRYRTKKKNNIHKDIVKLGYILDYRLIDGDLIKSIMNDNNISNKSVITNYLKTNLYAYKSKRIGMKVKKVWIKE